MKILITEFMEAKSVEMLNRNFDVTVDKSLSLNHNELKKIISNFDILIVRNKTQVNKEILENASSLKFIGRLGVGLDNIDTEYCRNNNIHVQPATGMNADSVAEYVINSALSLLKNIPIANIETQKGNWPRNTVLSRELKDKTIGILGFGLIGRKVCKIAQIFGAKVIAYDPYVDNKIAEEFDIKLESLDYVLNNSHIISLHIPLNNETNNLYLHSIKKCKKDNMTPKLWNQLILTNIPGVSTSIAIKINEVYPTITSLLNAYTNCETDNDRIKLLSTILLTHTEKQKRHIGKVISKRIYEYLYLDN